MLVVPVGGVTLLIRLRQAREGVRGPHSPRTIPVCLEDGPHEDHGAAATHSGFDQISRNALLEDVGDAMLEVVQPFHPNHRLGLERVIHAYEALLWIELHDPHQIELLAPQPTANGAAYGAAERPPSRQYQWTVPFRKNSAREALLQEIEIEFFEAHER